MLHILFCKLLPFRVFVYCSVPKEVEEEELVVVVVVVVWGWAGNLGLIYPILLDLVSQLFRYPYLLTSVD